VPCGHWTVRAARPGFENSEAAIDIAGSPVSEITLTMNPAINRQSVDVTDTPPPIEQASSRNYELHPAEVKPLPTRLWPFGFHPLA